MSLFNQSKNENGYTLVIALLLIVIITTISFSLIITTSNTLGVTKNEREDQSIFYIAESGANIEKIKVEDAIYKAYIAARDEHKATDPIQLPNKNFIDLYKEKIQTYLPQTKSIYTDFEKQLTKDPEACVDVSTAFKEDKLHITIQSAGYLKDDGSTINCENGQIPNNHRVVEKDVTVNLDLKFLTEIEGGGGGETDGEHPPIYPELPNLAVWTKGDIELGGSGGIIGDVLTTNGNVKIEGNG